MPAEPRPSPLARYSLLLYAVLVAYASLHPVSGWSAAGVDALAFVTAPLPRYIVRFDIVANIAGYAPLGFLTVLALYPKLRGAAAFATASAAAVLLSFVLEALQSYLPSRTPSNLDFAANSAGGILGAWLAARLTGFLLVEGGLHGLRYRLFRSGARIDLGLVVLGLWLFTQLDPRSLLFGSGDLRWLFNAVPGELHPAEVFISAEALVSCANAVAVGLVVALLAAPHQRVRLLALVTLALALAIHAGAYAAFFGRQEAFHWLTPGAYLGLGSGVVIVLAAIALPRPGQLALCALAIMAGAVLVNIAPENPYLADSLATWRQGYFAHLIGLARLASALWPFLALAYVTSLAGTR